MPVPSRLRFVKPTKRDVDEMVALCHQIEQAAIDEAPELDALLARWNARAARAYAPAEFRTYAGAISTKHFVKNALAHAPARAPDLTYAEARDVFAAVAAGELPPAEHDYFLDWLEENFPGANVSDLIYWPNAWFSDESMLSVELDADQLLHYAMSRSGRVLDGAPAVPLPRPDPRPAR